MELKDVREIYKQLDGDESRVEVYYRVESGEPVITMGYMVLDRVFERYGEVEDIPEQYPEVRKKFAGGPYILLYSTLGKNRLRTGEPHNIKIENIREIVPLFIEHKDLALLEKKN